MTEHGICYIDGYKYQLLESTGIQTSIFPPKDIHAPFYSIDTKGRIVAHSGYAWDGLSGPMFNTKSMMRASLFHDIGCQAINEGRLDPSCRPQVDAEFKRIGLLDGRGLGWAQRQVHKVRVAYAFRTVCAYTKLRDGSLQPEVVHNAP